MKSKSTEGWMPSPPSSTMTVWSTILTFLLLGTTYTVPATSFSDAMTTLTGRVVCFDRMSPSTEWAVGSRCCAVTIGAAKSFGNECTSADNASMPPADEPVTTSCAMSLDSRAGISDLSFLSRQTARALSKATVAILRLYPRKLLYVLGRLLEPSHASSRRRCSSRRRPSPPWRIAQVWWETSSRRTSGEISRSNGFRRDTRQSYSTSTPPSDSLRLQIPVPTRSPVELIVEPRG